MMENLLVGVMVDFRKAFDLVDHKILLNKLKCYKCNEKCSWFESYLSSRAQCVSLNNFQNQQVSLVAFLKAPFEAIYYF